MLLPFEDSLPAAAEAAIRPVFVTCANGHRELRLGDKVVKRFVTRATNQELVLRAFEEQMWAQRIDDPLPRAANIDPKRRLHDTITRLNRKQVYPLLRFHGSGDGQGVWWEAIRKRANRTSPGRQQRAT